MDAFKNWSRPVQITVGIIAGIILIGILANIFGTAEDEPEVRDTQIVDTTTGAEETTEPTEDAPTGNITDDIKALVGDDSVAIKTASDDGAVTIETSLVDPRANGPNDDTAAAMRICEAAAAEYPGRNIRVNEDDETAWVVLMTTRFQDYPIDECFEY